MTDNNVSYEAINKAELLLEFDEEAREIDTIDKRIALIQEHMKAEKLEIAKLEATSKILKTERANSYKRLRDSVVECVAIDAQNPRYFLKSASGVYNCVAFIAKIELTTEVKQKITITLSSLFKEKKIGRIAYKDVFYYGITDHFEQDDSGLYTILKGVLEGGLRALNT